jgi:hypothetical protein
MARTKQEDALMSQVANLEQQLYKKREELKAYRISRAGVSVGEVLESIERGVVRVARIEPNENGWGRPDLYVNLKKKDGTFGEREVHLWGKWSVLS